MSFPLTPAKRPYDRSAAEQNGKGKWKKSSSQIQPLKITPGSSCFRVLCPVSKSGSVIGKGGTIISNIRQETGAKVRVEEPYPGDDERVILIVGPETEKVVESNEEKKEGKDVSEEINDVKENDEKEEEKVSSSVDDSQPEKGASTVQKALMLVFERMVIGELEQDKGDDESKKSAGFIFRLLVFGSQVGCILGKGGNMIKQMQTDSGAQIRIIPRDKHPQCVSASDELVQLHGGVDAVRKGLQLVSQQLLENPPRDAFPASKPMGLSSLPFGSFSKPQFLPPNHHFPTQGVPYAAGPHDHVDRHSHSLQSNANFREAVIPGRARPYEMTFRLVCLNEKVGGIIGKAGSIVKMIHQDTGCDIRILEGAPDTEDRIVAITGSAHPDDTVSAVQEAVLRVQERIANVSENNEKIFVAKILVSTQQIGCLLGRAGAILQEMQQHSGASIRVVLRHETSKCASEDEEVVQITGGFDSVQAALMQITTRLRHHQFRDPFSSINHPTRPTFPEPAPLFPFLGRRDHSPPGMYSNTGPPFHNFDAAGALPPHGRIHPMDDRSGFMHNIHGPGMAFTSLSILNWVGGKRGIKGKREWCISAQETSEEAKASQVKVKPAAPQTQPPQLMAKSKNMTREYGGQWLSSVTRHVRIFAAYIDPVTSAFDQTQTDKLTLILDPTNEFLWTPDTCNMVYAYFQELVDHYEGAPLNEYTLRLIGSDIEHYIRKLLYDGEIKYNMNARVLNFSMGKPRVIFNDTNDTTTTGGQVRFQ